MSLIEDLSNLFLPTQCELCGRLPKPICDSCWASLNFARRNVSREGLAGWSITEYSEDIANLLNAFKERGQQNIGKRLARKILELVPRPSVQLLAAAPSSKVNFAARGFTPAEVIARELGRTWGLPVTTLRLEHSRQDQSQLDRSHRLINLAGVMTANGPLRQKSLLLVDDVVTTGSTLSEMSRALVEAGGLVGGFITVAETMPKTHTKNSKKV